MTHSKHAVAGWLLMVAAVAVLAAHLISDTSGAHLELAPVFVGAALAVAAMRMFRFRPWRPRSLGSPGALTVPSDRRPGSPG